MKNNILITLTLICSLNILSCSPAGILASGGATGMVVAEGDRSFGLLLMMQQSKLILQQNL